jgi:hypothetical protein
MTNRTVLLATVLAGTLYACGDFTSVDIASVERTLERQHTEVWSKGNYDSISSIYTEDYVGHFPGGQTVNGRDGLRKTVQSHRASFPNWDEQVRHIEHHSRTGMNKSWRSLLTAIMLRRAFGREAPTMESFWVFRRQETKSTFSKLRFTTWLTVRLRSNGHFQTLRVFNNNLYRSRAIEVSVN